MVMASIIAAGADATTDREPGEGLALNQRNLGCPEISAKAPGDNGGMRSATYHPASYYSPLTRFPAGTAIATEVANRQLQWLDDGEVTGDNIGAADDPQAVADIVAMAIELAEEAEEAERISAEEADAEAYGGRRRG
jgi:hypothetical protein